MNQIRYPVVDTSEIMEIRSAVVEEIPPSPRVEEDNIYVEVGKEVKESQLTLCWALDNLGGCKLSILYVHRPSEKIPFGGSDCGGLDQSGKLAVHPSTFPP
nr:U-box domain-containing protein kinase family protein [Tanacetum cinerariifolium]